MPSLQFKGKTFVENHHLAVPFHELKPVRSRRLAATAVCRKRPFTTHADQ